MDRRTVLGTAALALLSRAFPARAQPAGQVHRVGILAPTTRATGDGPTRVVAALGDLGYIEGQNLTVERRYADGAVDRLPALARELAARGVDVIVAVTSTAVRAAREATPTTPIVFYGNFDPVAAGFAASLARPGGQVTGAMIGAEGTLAAKRLELLRDAAPQVKRIGALVPDDPGFRPQLEEIRKAGRALSIPLVVSTVRGGDYERAFATLAAERIGALFVGAHTFFFRDRRPIIELAAKYRLPAIYEWPEHAEDGGLMAYGASLPALFQRVAGYVDRILRGARPGDLPIQQPTTFEFVINLRTAKTLGIELPPSLVQRASRLVE